MIRQLLLASFLLVSCSSDSINPTSYLYPMTDGHSIDLKAPQKLVLINYWAIWCAPCRKEVPELNELLHEHADKLQVVGVNFDGSLGDQLGAEVTKLGIEFPNFFRDPRQLWSLDPVAVLPETLIIDANGNLIHRLVGPQHKATLEELLKL